MQFEEKVQTYTSNPDPVTGEKRQRDRDDDQGQMHPNTRSSSGTGGSQADSGFAQAMQQSGVPAVSGFDALYIGDLQWVRLFCCIPNLCQSSKRTFRCSVFLILSGLPMKICDKLL